MRITVHEKNPYENQYHMTNEEFYKKYDKFGEKMKTSEKIEKEKQSIEKNIWTKKIRYGYIGIRVKKEGCRCSRSGFGIFGVSYLL